MASEAISPSSSAPLKEGGIGEDGAKPVRLKTMPDLRKPVRVGSGRARAASLAASRPQIQERHARRGDDGDA
jgi:hypothetical protein